ncbi:hypothetical protein MNBD_BACTEROID07-391 [hydrothermal vent metagenome]|uniref:Uncharacterized protein n=1 Tax=hydrothermal vent metagenome TaxID=652676 RepID=A0A3B0UFW5_9ZZZZ
MKKIIYFALIFFIGINASWAQGSQYADNLIDFNDVTINNIPVLQLDKASLIQHFGQPLSVSPYFNEMGNVYGDDYDYNGVEFYVERDVVMTFVVTGKQYSITPYDIKVGDNIDKLKPYLPQSFKNMKGDSKGYVVGVDIKETDRYLYIQTDPNYVITKISVISY